MGNKIAIFMKSFNPNCGLTQNEYQGISLLAASLCKEILSPEEINKLTNFLAMSIGNSKLSITLEAVVPTLKPQLKDPHFLAAFDLIRDICFYTRFEKIPQQSRAPITPREKLIELIRQSAQHHNFVLLALRLTAIDQQLLKSQPDLLKLHEKSEQCTHQAKEMDAKIKAFVETDYKGPPHALFHHEDTNLLHYFKALMELQQTANLRPNRSKPKNP